MYAVRDSYGYIVRGGFSRYRDAQTFLCVMGRHDWTICRVFPK